MFCDRLRAGVETGFVPQLDFDKREDTVLAGDEVDLPVVRAVVAPDHLIPLLLQVGKGDLLPILPAAQAEGGLFGGELDEKAAAVHRRDAVFEQLLGVQLGAIALVLGKAVLGILGIERLHAPIPLHLGEDGRSRDVR